MLRGALLVATLLLAGCTANVGSGGPGAPAGFGSPIEVGIEVTSAHVEPGRCFDRSTAFGEECHVLRLEFTNPGTQVVRVHLSWSASDAAGGGARDGEQQGFDSVAPGKTEPMAVRFTVREGSPPLTRVLFEGFPNARGEGNVPAYRPAAT
jgi:hypothetical protein